MLIYKKLNFILQKRQLIGDKLNQNRPTLSNGNYEGEKKAEELDKEEVNNFID